MIPRLYPAFAATDTSVAHGTRGMDLYKKWVQRVSQKEFADELIVAAAAIELKLCIVCIPYTPVGSTTPWRISKYQAPTEHIAANRVIHLGNNDVHYVLLKHP